MVFHVRIYRIRLLCLFSDNYTGRRNGMWILSIDKLEDNIYGCIDDGSNYSMFLISEGNHINYGSSYSKDDYEDYDHFVRSYLHIDPSMCFLEEPVEISAAGSENLTYEFLLEIFKGVWGEWDEVTSVFESLP